MMRASSFPSLLSLLTTQLLSLSALFQVALQTAAAEQPTCYWEYLNQLASAANDGPCGVANATSGVLECCSSGDTCLGDNICYGLSGSHTNGSGYYLSGCTDSNYTSSTCTSHCLSNGYPDIVYNTTTGLWACCTVNDFKVDCKFPTTEVWSAPAPSSLTGIWIANSATAAAAASSSISISSTSTSSASLTSSTPSSTRSAPTSTSTTISQPTSSSSLSTPVKAAIATVTALFTLALLFLTTALIRARRQNRTLVSGIALVNARAPAADDKPGHFNQVASYIGGGSGGYSQVPEESHTEQGTGEARPLHELSAQTTSRGGLSATISPGELGSWDGYYGGGGRGRGGNGVVKKHDTYYHP